MQSRPSEDQVLLHIAYAMAARGTCPSIQVGCVISRDGRILTTGYNGAPAGMPHCTHPPHISTGLGDASARPCTTAIHAEMNAVAFAARHGTSLLGAKLTTTLSPCRTCAQLVIQAGIVAVQYGEEYRDLAGVGLLNDAHVATQLLGIQ